MEDGDPGADVANGDREVVGVVRRAAQSPSPPATLSQTSSEKPTSECRVVGAGGDEERALCRKERLLGDSRRPVRGADRRNGHTGEHERPAGGGESGDRHPVGHGASLRSRRPKSTHLVVVALSRWTTWMFGFPRSRAGSSSGRGRGRGRVAPARDPPPRRRRELGAGRDAGAAGGEAESRSAEAARDRRCGCGAASGSLPAASRARGSTTRSRWPAGRRRRRSWIRSISPRRSPTESKIVVPGRGVGGVAAASAPAAGSSPSAPARPELRDARRAREPAGNRAGDRAEDPRLPAAARRIPLGCRTAGRPGNRACAHGAAEGSRDPVK